MKVLKISICFFIFAFSGKLLSSNQLETDSRTITAIEPEFTDDQTYIHLQFDRALSSSDIDSIESYQTFSQIIFKKAESKLIGKFWEINSQIVSKIAMFQPTSTEISLRIFPNQGIELDSGDIQVERLGSRMIVSIRHAIKIQDSLNAKNMGPPRPVLDRKDLYIQDKNADAIVDFAGNTGFEGNNLKKNNENDVKRENGIESTTKENPIFMEGNKKNLTDILVKVAVFLGVLLICGILFVWNKRVLLMRGLNVERKVIPTINNLSTLSVSPRQKISLIEVGKERFLIGVGPGEIKLLTQIDCRNRREEVYFVTNSSFKHEMIAASRREDAVSQRPMLPHTKVPKATHKNSAEELKPIKSRKIKEGESANLGQKNQGNRSVGEGSKISQKIQVAVGDDGIKNLSPRFMLPRDHESEKRLTRSNNVADDVTKLIRDRISGLKTI